MPFFPCCLPLPPLPPPPCLPLPPPPPCFLLPPPPPLPLLPPCPLVQAIHNTINAPPPQPAPLVYQIDLAPPPQPPPTQPPPIQPSPIQPSPTQSAPPPPAPTATGGATNNNSPQEQKPTIEWIPTTINNAGQLTIDAVASTESQDDNALWVIRSWFNGELIPGRLDVKQRTASVPWGGNENSVIDIEVCSARPDKIQWVAASNGIVPNNAVVAGNTTDGEALYVGRARHNGVLTSGKVHVSHKTLYISFAGREIAHKDYEVLCTI